MLVKTSISGLLTDKQKYYNRDTLYKIYIAENCG